MQNVPILITLSVAAPGFPRGGGANPPAGANMNFAKFPKNCMELKEIGRGGGASKILLCRSATELMVSFHLTEKSIQQQIKDKLAIYFRKLHQIF